MLKIWLFILVPAWINCIFQCCAISDYYFYTGMHGSLYPYKYQFKRRSQTFQLWIAKILSLQGRFSKKMLQDFSKLWNLILKDFLNQSQVWNEINNTNAVSDPALNVRGDSYGYKTTTKCFVKAKAVWASVTIGLTCFYFISKKIF